MSRHDIWHLVKFLWPKFYNRITWAIVATGLVLVSKPLWLMILEQVLSKSFEIDITSGNDLIVGIILVFGALIYQLAASWLEKHSDYSAQRKKSAHKHDQAVFTSADAIMNEQQFNDFLMVLENDHSYRDAPHSQMVKFAQYLSKSENMYLDKSLQTATNELLTAINNIQEMLGLRFHSYPDIQTGDNWRFCLEPSLNCDRGGSWERGKEYQDLANELARKTQSIWSAFLKYRKIVKTVYHI